MRADKWLWHARFFKTRGLATKVISGGHLRLNGNKVSKPAQKIVPGDVLTFAQGREVRVIRVVALSLRRGPASEAQGLYEDLAPASEREKAGPERERNAQVTPRKGRPSGKDRRTARLLKGSCLE
ncbi:MAG: RNA-binding protein S4 [Rhodobacterales bacterium]|nr:MAG: RNA-binding protein S4 [Rhodobacterales bacterium]